MNAIVSLLKQIWSSLYDPALQKRNVIFVIIKLFFLYAQCCCYEYWKDCKNILSYFMSLLVSSILFLKNLGRTIGLVHIPGWLTFMFS